ncbi:MAG: Succinyl-diaminopimelate desuccinylase [Legionellaceae bacterium]
MMSMTSLELAQALIAKPSITPDDAGCQEIIAHFLKELGFSIELLRFGNVDNLWAKYANNGPLFTFVGHTDVVPTGPENEWNFPPFQPTLSNGYLYGRGAADMKASIAAMLIAYKKFLAQYPHQPLSLGFLITSDEEGPGIDGVAKVMEVLEKRQEKIQWALVGEPSSSEKIGDVIKNGRRGSLTGKVTIQGKQGHIAYPELAINPIHIASRAIAELCDKKWDNGNEFFPPTRLQFSQIQSGGIASNVIPGNLTAVFNFRYSTETNADILKQQVNYVFSNYNLDFDIEWIHSGQPFLTHSGKLLKASINAIEKTCGYIPHLSTSGGTSDGRFIAPTGSEVIELGLCNATIHQVNECIAIEHLFQLETIYFHLLEELCKLNK